jgi:hypothetical protein
MGIHDKFGNPNSAQMVECKCDERFPENRQQRLWNDMSQRSKPSPNACSQYECFAKLTVHDSRIAIGWLGAQRKL